MGVEIAQKKREKKTIEVQALLKKGSDP